MRQKQCPRCGVMREWSEYTYNGRGACKPCRAEKMRLIRAAKKGKAEAPETPTETPENAAPESVLDIPRVEPPPPPPADLFENRASLDAYLQQEMATTVAQYNTLIAEIKAQLAYAKEHKLVSEWSRASQSLRSAIQAKDTYQQRLTKQFKPLSHLDRPPEESREFAPVILVLQLDPPASALVASIETRQADDVQPDPKQSAA